MSNIPNLTEAAVNHDLKSDVPPQKPTYLHVKLCDNGWLVGVHYAPNRDTYECAPPSEQYVFNNVKSLAEGLALVAMGKKVPANLTAA